MPISGFLYTAMGGFPVPYFGLYDLANLVLENKPLAEVFESVHVSLQEVLYAVVALHVGGLSSTSSSGRTGCCDG